MDLPWQVEQQVTCPCYHGFNMLRISSEKELVESFRPMEREEVILPRDLAFPLIVRDYQAWSEPSGHRVFLVLAEPGRKQPMGIVFQRSQASSSETAAHPQMCDWCHSVRAGNGVSLLT